MADERKKVDGQCVERGRSMAKGWNETDSVNAETMIVTIQRSLRREKRTAGKAGRLTGWAYYCLSRFC